MTHTVVGMLRPAILAAIAILAMGLSCEGDAPGASQLVSNASHLPFGSSSSEVIEWLEREGGTEVGHHPTEDKLYFLVKLDSGLLVDQYVQYEFVFSNEDRLIGVCLTQQLTGP